MTKPCCSVTGYGSGLSGFDVHAPGCSAVKHRECGRPWGEHVRDVAGRKVCPDLRTCPEGEHS